MSVTMKMTLAATALFAGVALSAPSWAEELKLGVITPPPHVWTKAANHFGDLLKEKSGGALTVVVFPSGQLGAEPEMFQQMQAGILDMGLMTGALTSLREPSIQGWFTPFLMGSVEEAAMAAKTPAAQEMLSNLDKLGLKGLGYSFAGMRHILTTKGTISGLDDLKGQKIRIVPFPAMKVWWEATGAVPTPIQLPDIYQALQSGLLDGVDIDLDALVGLKFQEVAKGLTLTNHMVFPAVAMMGKAKWDELGPEKQAMVTEAMDETLAWATERQIEAEQTNLETLKAAIEVTTLENAETVFADANAAFAEAFGSDPLITAFQEQVKAAKAAR
ncbi:MAG: TRAP transporter substrate-binding protein [Rhodospirillum sp.]|nr:TRAP transporter substrate-binding protein [Rhodospirillum sp.]MCF8489767.1 TRAP transporter substrate-binding protein [Rhodospirillum sp.]MCF8501268.1 TRAP transporter substrate-binding protein [Rhodospirillum sp.]